MRTLNLQEVADYLESAKKIESTESFGHAVVNAGYSETGARFVLMVDCHGAGALTEF